mmetsp:Transcript_14923/g.14310  ORF Transcript_14923/g.14310 Transcript_14923/m.14310 type:complete len:299 (+) Transcript_14923:245-1141(+)|eukprot:CAMPEP_0119034336 /NCGR_PEP_ID=MMETSP1177-20130426/1327_1 /TAXON_ID=2985 /ORGANISM="Ochromonas sp, Strain CCMP1899" /LENGTH=298 /DNA_ID=CAMNT_0006991695 /DNA_START=200 /DNA_END=1096 /DNA_ORIENTATION=+
MAEVEVNRVNRSAAVAVGNEAAGNSGAAQDSDSEDDENVGGIELLPLNYYPVDNPENRKKFRGKNKRMTILATYENMENAMMDFTKEQLTQNEQVLGRSIKGDNASRYVNCNKTSSGCKKAWRLSYKDHKNSGEVILEETCEDHSNHFNHMRNGGHGMTHRQIAIVQAALAQDIRKPLKVIDYFTSENEKSRRRDPLFVDVPIPEIPQLRNYISKSTNKSRPVKVDVQEVQEGDVVAEEKGENEEPDNRKKGKVSLSSSSKVTDKKETKVRETKVKAAASSLSSSSLSKDSDTEETTV